LDHVCWTTGGEVRRVGLRAGRFVEVGPRASRFVEACYILVPWSIICVTYRLEYLRGIKVLGQDLTKMKYFLVDLYFY